MRRTTKLIESGHRGLQANRPICYYFYVFYVFFLFFQNPKSRDFLRFLPCLAYVFSNYKTVSFHDIMHRIIVVCQSYIPVRGGRPRYTFNYNFASYEQCTQRPRSPPSWWIRHQLVPLMSEINSAAVRECTAAPWADYVQIMAHYLA